ncbi:hypothetical protein [Paenibacillus oleatilyticus]|uniref:hypothetical protein n=1 Tax=Paenibacillus oleatilyticus TaxID=2594886 RepID=UPI001C1F36D1|nr:hypothetical protein [Paenibacillus oleatilyticus]MBU7315320.1 hypothetical protein [Paenibacillus oleatilyticus]
MASTAHCVRALQSADTGRSNRKCNCQEDGEQEKGCNGADPKFVSFEAGSSGSSVLKRDSVRGAGGFLSQVTN